MTQDSITWSELAELTHATQVEQFNFCMCEDTEPDQHPYSDCPKTELQLKTPRQLAREARDARNTSKTNKEFDYWHNLMLGYEHTTKTGDK